MDYRLPKRVENPFTVGYCPKLDVPPVLGPDETSYYQALIEVMRWIVKIGCINIDTKVSLLSWYSGVPRQGHLEAVLNIMGYLKCRYNSRLVFDPTYPNIDHTNFFECDWTDFCQDVVVTIPFNAPLSREKEVDLHICS